MAESKMTPLPWRVEGGPNSPYPCEVWGTTERGLSQVVARCPGAKIRDANAAFIVKAVNCHPELMDMLRRACALLEVNAEDYAENEQSAQWAMADTMVEDIRAVLAKAEA